MQDLVLKVNSKRVRFKLYGKEAPMTCRAFIKALPFKAKAMQARFAGEEIWVPKGPGLKIPGENSSTNPQFGEIGYAPLNSKSEIANSIAIVYGEAKLSGRVNLFGKVFVGDKNTLKHLGKKIWLEGARVITFEPI